MTALTTESMRAVTKDPQFQVAYRLTPAASLTVMWLTCLVLLAPYVWLLAMTNLSATSSRLLHFHRPFSVLHLDYDVKWLQNAHLRSAPSVRDLIYQGDNPLFPPCNTSLPPGPPTWGPFKYVGPFDYVKGSKNPCWKNAAGKLSCVPYFYLAGVSKSGTSDIFERICLHPDVITQHKEHHWFDRHRYRSGGLAENLSFELYLERFDCVTKAIDHDLQSLSFSKKITGDGTPSYFYDSLQWRRYPGNENCTEPRMLLPHHIHHLYPGARIILSFRHPVSRLFSRYLYDYAPPRSPELFHQRVVGGLAEYSRCFQSWSLRRCAYNRTLALSVGLRLGENLYPVLMEDWLKIFPRQQLLLIRFEDYCRNMTKELYRIFTFLDLDPLNATAMKEIASPDKVKNKGRGYSGTGPMMEKTVQVLQEFYRPFLRRFARLVGDDRFLWTDVKLLRK